MLNSALLQGQSIFINEFLASNDTGLADDFDEFEDWVELYNPGNTAIDIGGMYLTDDLANPTLWQIPTTDPSATTIAAGGFLVVFFDKQTDQGILHIDAKLSANGEAIGLYAADGVTVIDSYTFGIQQTDVSEGRIPDGGMAWGFFSNSTPGSTNDATPIPDVTEIPVADIGGGLYPAGSMTITLTSATPDATIYYTLDASDPDNNATEYTGPITINDVSTIRAIAYKTSFEPSKVMTHSYLIGVSHTFAILALNTDPDHLYDSEEGIIENYKEDIEQPAHLAFYEPDGTLAFAQDIAIEIHGAAAAGLPQKSLKLKAKAGLGNEFFNYPIFPDLPYDQYRSFLVRNSGQDWNKSWVRDALSQNIFTDLSDLNGIIKDPDLDSQGYRPGVVYLNGEYYGIYNIREQMNWKYLNTHYGIQDGEVDIIERINDADDGDDIEWDAFQEFLETTDMSIDANYEQLKTKVDPKHYIDYQLQGILLDNNDWPGQNNKHWRERTPDGVWRWMTKDLDFGFGLRPLNGDWNSGEFTTNMVEVCLAETASGYYNPPEVTIFLRRLMENSESKNYFINRAADLLNVVFNSERVLGRINAFEDIYIPELDQHMDIWQSGYNGTPGNIEKLRNFATGREDAVREHVENYFNEIDGTTDVTINANPANGGSVGFSTMTLGEAVFPWEGIYFQGVDIPITAIPSRGYFFEDWSGGLGNNAQTSVNISSGNYNLTANFVQGSTATDPIVINEINYNSPDDVDPGDWVELYNPNAFSVDISGWYFEDESGNFFGLPANTIMPADSYFILVEEEDLFFSVFPGTPNVFGNFARDPGGFKLSGKGEKISLSNADGVLIDEVNFDDKAPWPEEADGNGPTLQLITPSLDNALPESWFAFAATPGMINGAPLITFCPLNIEVTIAGGSTETSVNWLEPEVNNICNLGGTSILQTTGFTNGGNFPVGVTTVIYEATNACGDSAICSFTITVSVDNGNLNLSCPGDLNISTAPGAANAVVSWATPSVSTTCPSGGAMLTQTGGPVSGSLFELGTTAIVYEATDNCGNIQTCSFNVNVTDTPSSLDLVCPDAISIAVAEGSGGQIITWSDPEASTNCSAGGLSVSQTNGLPSGNFFAIGTYTISYEATNACGDSEVCSFTIEVSESSGTLELTCPDDINIDIPSGATSVAVNWPQPVTSSTCNGGTVNSNCNANDLPGFDLLGEIGEHKYFISTEKDTWENAKAACESFGAHLVVITDAAENLFLQNNTFVSLHTGLNDLNTEGTYEWINGEPFVYQNFDTENNSDENDYGYFRSWNAAWTMRAGDVNKNYVMEMDCGGGSSIDLTQTSGPNNGSNLTAGTYTVTYSASDDCGGLQSCSFEITVTAPVPSTSINLDCPDDISISVPEGSVGQTVNWSAPQASTDCTIGNLSTTQTSGSASGSFFSLGTQTITYEAVNGCGDLESCSFTINIQEDVVSTDYCASEGNLPWQEHITNVTFGSINNPSGKDGYGDFTDQSTTVVAGETYPISIQPKFSYTQYDEYFQVWIDFNNDSDFNDPGELVFAQSRAAGPGGTVADPLTGTVAIPLTLEAGSTRMRVSMARDAYASPCDIFERGEVEDYTVILSGSSTSGNISLDDYSAVQAAAPSNNSKGTPVTNERIPEIIIDAPPITKDDFIAIFPNPAMTHTTLVYTLLKPTVPLFSIYNSTGKLMGQQLGYYSDKGYNRFELSLEGFENGLYLIMMETATERATQKLLILK